MWGVNSTPPHKRVMMIDTLIEDIYNARCSDQGRIEGLDDFLDEVKKAVIGHLTEDRKDTFVRPSNFGKQCQRSLWYDIHSPEPISNQLKLRFLTGHIMEALVLLLAKVSGHDVKDKQRRVELSGMTGSLDAIVDNHLVDVKTASDFSFKKYLLGLHKSTDSFGYIPQLSYYKACVSDSVNEDAFLLVLNKNNSQLALVPVETLSTDEVASMANEAIAMAKEKAPPPIPYEIVTESNGNMTINKVCTFCEHKMKCYKGLRTFKYSSGLKYLTEVKKQPRVEEITDGE